MAALFMASRCRLRPRCAGSWLGRRTCAAGADAGRRAGEIGKDLKYDMYNEEELSSIAPSSMWKVRIDHKFSEQDFSRFAVEHSAFLADPRLRPASLPGQTGLMEIDWQSNLKGTLGIFRLGDYFTEPFKDNIVERLTEQGDLMEHFQIPRLQDMDATKPLHNHAVPKGGVYGRLRLQAYWLALHIWLLHSKQFALQEDEGVFGSALCALITRRMFEWSWNQVRGWMHEVDVPVMSLSDEVKDLQEYIFGFCVALDQAFKDEAPGGTTSALALGASDLPEGCYGLAPQVKHVLWSNVYSGVCPQDAPCLHELTVYTLRQRALMEGLARGDFFMCRWNWADFDMESVSRSAVTP